MSTQPAPDDSYDTHELRKVHEGQVLRLAGSSFAVLTKERRDRLVHLILEAEDGVRVTLIGVPGARVRAHKGLPHIPLQSPGPRT